jgi:hypothetical protein
MSYIYNLTDTWNAAGTTFAGIKMAVTNTASGASSNLLDLSVSGATTASFTVNKSGNASLSGALTLGTALTVANGGTGASSAGIAAFNNITGYTASGATGTTSTNLVFSTSPTLVTPVLGVASATSLALGGAAIGSNALAITGTMAVTGDPTFTCNFPTFTSANGFTPQVTIQNTTADANGPYINYRKSRGGTTAVQASDTLGTFIFQGYNSSSSVSNAAYITSVVESVGASSVTARMEFITVNAAPIIFGIPGEAMRITSSGTVTINNQTTVCSAVATPAAGSTSARLLFGTTAGFGIYYGSGAPTVSAAQGSIYLRSDGTKDNRLYINTNGATTWTAFTTTA